MSVVGIPSALSARCRHIPISAAGEVTRSQRNQRRGLSDEAWKRMCPFRVEDAMEERKEKGDSGTEGRERERDGE
eukprot:1350356-Rhodomonas_salina.2